MVVGQGQLDSVLQSRPEDRRAYIEEAAGVLKHRKRKEKALRKLDAMQANLTRLTDLTGELRRQLKPLGRQAEIARRAQTIQSELRDARLRLAADDLVTLRDELAREEADESQARARRAEVERQLSAARVEQERLETALAQDAPRLAAAQDTWYRLSALAERLRGTVRLAQERSRHLADPQERIPGRDPDELDAEAEAAAEQEAELVEALVQARRLLADVTEERTDTERRLAAAERAHLAAVRALADRRAGLATLAGRAEALRSGAAATTEEIERLSEALAEALQRVDAAERELATAGDELGEHDDDSARELEQHCIRAVEAHEVAGSRVAELVAREREVEQQRAHWRARVDALSVGLARRDGSAALLDDGAPAGMLGPVPGLITVEPWARTALAAALGDLADAVAVASPAAAVQSLRLLRDRDAGRATLLIGGEPEPGPELNRGLELNPELESKPEPGPGPDVDPEPGPESGKITGSVHERPDVAVSAPDRRSCAAAATVGAASDGAAPPSGRWVADLLTAPPPLAVALRRLLHGTVVVDDLDSARSLVDAHPELTAVTTDGDLLGAARAHGGSGAAGSPLDVQAEVTEASAARDRVEQELTELRPDAGGGPRRGGRPAGRPGRGPAAPGRRRPAPIRGGHPAGPAGAGRPLGHGRGPAAARTAGRGGGPPLRRAARTGGRRAAARAGRGRAGRRRAGHRDPRRRGRGAGRRPLRGGRGPARAAHRGGAGPGDRRARRVAAPAGVR